MGKFKDIPLKYQLIVMIFSITFLSLWIASTAFVFYDRYTYKKNMEMELTVLARIIANRSADAIERGNLVHAEEHLKSLGVKPEIISACLSDLAGLVLASYSRNGSDIECLSSQPFIARFEGGFLDLLQPIIGPEGKRGELHIRENLSQLNKRFAVFSVAMLLIVVLASIVAITLSSRIQGFISAPISNLTDIARRVTHDGIFSVRAETDRRDEIGELVLAFNNMLEKIEEQRGELLNAKHTLEDQVEERTSELKTINKELEAFTYSVSHDLRAPLRAIDGFSLALKEDYEVKFDEAGKDYLKRIRSAGKQMGELIESMLYLSRVSRQELYAQAVNLTSLADQVTGGLESCYSGLQVSFKRPDTLLAYGDKALLLIVLENLIGNAWKYSAKVATPRVELGSVERKGDTVYFIKDNGAGFDMKYADKLFGPFQRLHRSEDFEGLGVGLATVARIIYRHGGEIWAESIVGEGAVFYFTLGRRHA